MSTLERAVAVWKKCREVEVGISCKTCPLFADMHQGKRQVGLPVCTVLYDIDALPKLAEELDKREAK